jgi:hypothetical protein
MSEPDSPTRLGSGRPLRAMSALCLLLIGAGGLGWLAHGALPAGADLVFTATSAAEATQVELNSDAVPLSTDTAAGGPTAQTLMDSNGTSQAYAASPDPSQTGATLPALVCSLAGLPLPAAACNYPAFAATERGQPAEMVGTPGNEVTAQSGDTSSQASVQSGVAPGPQISTTSATQRETGGSVTTTAAISATSVGIEGAIVIQGLHETATATSSPDGKVTSTQDLSISSVQVAGQSFGFENGSFFLPGSPSIVVPWSTVSALTQQAGVTTQFVQPIKTSSGVVGSAVAFTYMTPPTPAAPASTVTVTFGKASADILASAVPGTTAPQVATGTGPVSVPSTPVPGAGAALPAVASNPNSTPMSPAPQSLPSLAVGAGRAASPSDSVQPASAGTRVSPLLSSSRRPWTYKMATLYLTLVAAGIAIFAVASGVRLLGVKLPWRY